MRNETVLLFEHNYKDLSGPKDGLDLYFLCYDIGPILYELNTLTGRTEEGPLEGSVS